MCIRDSAGAAAPAAETALLLRGWAPDSWTDVDPKAGACVKTGGVARASEMRGRFTPDNDPSEDRWFWLDAPALARSRGLPEDTPLIQAVNASEDESAAVVYPVAVKESELMAINLGRPPRKLLFVPVAPVAEACVS